MDYSKLKKELLLHLRGQLAQSQVNKKLGVSFNKTYRWESGTSHLMWPDFVDLCEVLKIPLDKYLADAFSFREPGKNTAALVQHFTGETTLKDTAQSLKISRYTLSRWLKDTSAPTIEQMFELMDFASPEFLKFLELLTGGVILPSSAEEMRLYHAQVRHYFAYPWMSILLSAIETKGYAKNPTESYLAEKTKIPLNEIKKAIPELAESGVIKWSGKRWRCDLHRVAVKATSKDLMKMANYVYGTTLNAVPYSPKNENIRLAYKMFSLNKKAYPLLLQRFSEFFMDLGKIIDAHQQDADGVYMFSTGIIDFDELKENPFNKEDE
jgi:transcriptional regulator with XRE-family HTH domain